MVLLFRHTASLKPGHMAAPSLTGDGSGSWSMATLSPDHVPPWRALLGYTHHRLREAVLSKLFKSQCTSCMPRVCSCWPALPFNTLMGSYTVWVKLLKKPHVPFVASPLSHRKWACVQWVLSSSSLQLDVTFVTDSVSFPKDILDSVLYFPLQEHTTAQCHASN